MQKVGIVMLGGRGVSKSVWLCQLLFEWSWLESDFWSGEIHLHTFSTRLRLRRCIFQEVRSTLANRVRARLSDVDLSDWSSCSRSIALTAVRVQEAMLWVYYIQFFFSTSTGIHAWQTSHRPIPIPNSLTTHHLVLLDCRAASLMLSQDMSRSRCTVTVTFFGLMDLSNQASAVCLERPSHFHTLSKHKTRQTKNITKKHLALTTTLSCSCLPIWEFWAFKLRATMFHLHHRNIMFQFLKAFFIVTVDQNNSVQPLQTLCH